MVAHSSIEKMYAVFADVQKPNKIDFCPCCMASEEIEALISLPLNEIPRDLMCKYGGNSIYTVGGVEEYRYFFPRLLELVIIDRGFWPDWEVVLGKLKLASWDSWDGDQKKAIESLIDECFDELINEPDPEGLNVVDIEGFLVGVVRSGLSSGQYMKRVLASQHKNEFKNFIFNTTELDPPMHGLNQ